MNKWTQGAELDWERMGQAIEERRGALDLSKAAVARRGPIDSSTLYHAIQGSKRSAATYEKIEKALNWPAGTLERIGQGGDPPEDALDDSARLRRIEERATSQEMEVRRLTEEVRDLNGELSALSDQLAEISRRVSESG